MKDITSSAADTVHLGGWRCVIERRHYCTFLSWLLAIYDRVLNSRLLFRLPFRGRVVKVRLHCSPEPFFVRLGTSDWMVLDELFIHKGYASALEQCSQDVRTVVDLGANIGLSVRLFGQCFPNAGIVAVEPDAGNLAICRLNIERIHSRCRLLEGAVGGSARIGHLDRSGGAWAFRLAQGSPKPEDCEVQVMTMGQIISQIGADAGVDLLKCDIEGGERELFHECSGWIRRIRHLIVEVHNDYRPEDLLGDLERNGVSTKVQILHRGIEHSVLFLQMS